MSSTLIGHVKITKVLAMADDATFFEKSELAGLNKIKSTLREFAEANWTSVEP